MSQFSFLVLALKNSTPKAWLCEWAGRYSSDREPEYQHLIARSGSFSAKDFVGIGKWKDGVKTERQWRRNVASVAYPIWMQAARELPTCPKGGQVRDFLGGWSGRTYTNAYPNRSVCMSFGLSRATTLLHFLSRGRFPIFDSRVNTAVPLLLGTPVPPRSRQTVDWYLDYLWPIVRELADLCGTGADLRKLDKALFSYGASVKLIRELA